MDEEARAAIRKVRDDVEEALVKAGDALDAAQTAAARLAELLGDDE